MTLLRDLLSDKSGVSCMRFMSLCSLFISATITYYCLYTKQNISEITPIVGTFVAAAFGGKIGQKYIESKGEKE